MKNDVGCNSPGDQQDPKGAESRFVERLIADPPRSDEEPARGGGTAREVPHVVQFGQRIGNYEVLSELGRGGMGAVYKAKQPSPDRFVALKTILAGQFASEMDIRRFHAEVEAAGRLEHPNIVPIYEVGEHEGLHYFSMRFIAGQSLQDRILDCPLPPKEAATLLKVIAYAVQYAHEMGVTHRDLKPKNVLLDEQNQPHLSDFGLAKRTHADSELTATGQIVGTPSYMAPEQARFSPDIVGPTVDVYGLGATLYCCLTGHPPFKAASPVETLEQVLGQDPVSPRLQNPRVPRDLETICLKSLHKDPKDRYPSAAEFGDDLGRFLADEPIKARRINPVRRFIKWCSRNPWRAVAVMLPSVLCLALAVAILKVTSAHRLERESRHYAEQIFGWSTDSLGQFENAFRFDERFPNDDQYRDLQSLLLKISTDHYQRIVDLKRDDPQEFPFLEAKRGDAHWWLGTVEVRNAYATQTTQVKGLERFTEMQTIFRDLHSAHPDNNDFKFRYGWSCGWRAFALNELGRGEEAIGECQLAIEILSSCQHPQSSVKLGACNLELALMAARRGDSERADHFVRIAVQTLDSDKTSNDAFIEADRLYFKTERVRMVADELVLAGCFQAAARTFERLTVQTSNDPWHWYHRAIAELGHGDEKAHRDVRTELLARFGNNEPSDRIAYAFAALPLDAQAIEQRLALTFVAEKLPEPRPRAAILYRLDRFEDAIACLDQGSHGRAWDHLLFALCYARAGRKELARQSVHSALKWIEEEKLKGKVQGWTELIETSFLFREAEGLGLTATGE